VAKPSATKLPLPAAEILGFLKTFEGAASSFGQEDGQWSLWLPELAADEYPLTPASQIFFPVILKHGEQAFAIRFFYDCSTGKIRYYTSAIPEDVARLPELENAISELFRHSLPVEAIRQRSLARKIRSVPVEGHLRPRSATPESLAEPVDRSASSAPSPPPSKTAITVSQPKSHSVVPYTRQAEEAAPVKQVTLATSEETPAIAGAPHPKPSSVGVHFEIGPRARTVLLVTILVLGVVALSALVIYAFLESTPDSGVLHHRLQLEELRLRDGR
jgi:hypothetical protein